MNICASALTGERGRDLLSIAETSIASRFHYWLGASGRRYIASVFAVEPGAPDRGLPDFDACLVIPVRRQGAERVALFVRQVESHLDARSVRAAGLAAGAEEWHVHFLAEDAATRNAAADDLRPAQARQG